MIFKEKFILTIIVTLIILFVEVVVEGHISEMFYGTWVYDKSYPLYVSSQCPFMQSQFNCKKHKRPDKDYMKYRWQPNLYSLPRFEGAEFVKRMNRKRIMFVGDSLSTNQWQSLACMIYVSDRHRFAFKQLDSTLSLRHLAVLSDIDDVPGLGRVLKLDSMKGGLVWKNHDVLIFNMWNSWLHTQFGYPWDYIEVDNQIFKNIEIHVAIEKVLRTWARWVDENINPFRTKVFFVGPVPNHFYGYEWGREMGRNCRQETKPFPGSSYPYTGLKKIENLLERVLKSIKKPVYFLNVTLLSQLRIDGHPGDYTTSNGWSIDCDNWCLPGVPDTWNELLSAALLQRWDPFNS